MIQRLHLLSLFGVLFCLCVTSASCSVTREANSGENGGEISSLDRSLDLREENNSPIPPEITDGGKSLKTAMSSESDSSGTSMPCVTDKDCAAGEECKISEEGDYCACAPSEEVCDGTDNDCDGIVDGDFLCPKGRSCIDGLCACEEGMDCDGTCVQTATDPEHCGDCGISCTTQQFCKDGSCICSNPLELCGDSCVDLMIDLVHCGSCNQVCKGGSTCKEGICTCMGPGSPQLCGSICANLSTDSLHCGECDQSCPVGSTCVDGECFCGNGAGLCSDSCVDMMKDILHCGACDQACAPGATCIEGQCLLPASRQISPLSGSISTLGTPTFVWASQPGQNDSRIDICSDPDCGNIIQSHDVPGNSFTVTAPLDQGMVYWRVKAVKAPLPDGPYTPPWALMVGSSSPGDSSYWGMAPDIDMDGRMDLAVGVCGLGDTCSQQSWIYRGPITPGQAPTQILNGPVTTLFGYATSLVGDLNGDGRSDLAVGSWLTYNIWVYLSNKVGIFDEYTMLEGAPGIFPMFGHDVAPAGDINQDGYADLITGDPIGSAGYIYFGGPNGVNPDNSLTLYAATGGGITVTGGCDIDGDGRDDAFVGGPPSLAVFATPDSSEPSQIIEKTGTNFGIAVDCAGDTNGDGFLDVIVGAGANDSTFVYFGSPVGLDTQSEVTLEGGIHFGLAVAGIGDVNQDGYDDVAVGGDSVVQVHLGSADGIEVTPVQTLVGAHNSFGTAITGIKDLTGDGFIDLIIGSPGEGSIYLFPGNGNTFDDAFQVNNTELLGLGNSLGMGLP